MKLIYFIESGEGGPIKIGTAKNIASRIVELQVGNPFELRVIVTVRGDLDKELAIHRRFSSERLRGEWFRGDGEVRAFAEALASMSPFDAEYALACEFVIGLGRKPKTLHEEPKHKLYTQDEWTRVVTVALTDKERADRLERTLRSTPLGDQIVADVLGGRR